MFFIETLFYKKLLTLAMFFIETLFYKKLKNIYLQYKIILFNNNDK